MLALCCASLGATWVLPGKGSHAGAASSLLTGLKGYWDMDESSGSRADSSGLGYTLVETGTVSSTTGKISNAADLTGGGELLSVADNADLSGGNTDFSIALWAYFDTLSGQLTVLSKDNGAKWDYLIYTSGTTLHFYADNTTGSGFFDIEWGSALSTATWYHIVVKHDAAADTVYIIVNDGTPVTSSHTGGTRDTAGSLTIGAEQSGANAGDLRVDELGVWKKVLSAAEITSLYNGGSGISHPF